MLVRRCSSGFCRSSHELDRAKVWVVHVAGLPCGVGAQAAEAIHYFCTGHTGGSRDAS